MVSAPGGVSPQQRILAVLPANRTSDAAQDAAARKDLTLFATRAFRRPVTGAEVDRLAHIAALVRHQGGSFERSMQFAMQGCLVSPNFLFRIERDTDPANRHVQHAVPDYDLATRLSYFLWSTMPDDRPVQPGRGR